MTENYPVSADIRDTLFLNAPSAIVDGLRRVAKENKIKHGLDQIQSKKDHLVVLYQQKKNAERKWENQAHRRIEISFGIDPAITFKVYTDAVKPKFHKTYVYKIPAPPEELDRSSFTASVGMTLMAVAHRWIFWIVNDDYETLEKVFEKIT